MRGHSNIAQLQSLKMQAQSPFPINHTIQRRESLMVKNDLRKETTLMITTLSDSYAQYSSTSRPISFAGKNSRLTRHYRTSSKIRFQEPSEGGIPY